MNKPYIASQQYWEDNINDDYDKREQHDKEQPDYREQPDDRIKLNPKTMNKKEKILNKHHIINGFSIRSNPIKIKQDIYDAMDENTNIQLTALKQQIMEMKLSESKINSLPGVFDLVGMTHRNTTIDLILNLFPK